MKILIAAAAIAAALPAAVSAQAPAPVAQQCFMHSQLRNTVVVDDSTINALVDKDVWQIRMQAPCPGLEMSRAGYVLRLGPAAGRFCGPNDFHITVNDFGAARCFVQSVRPLTTAEVAALPPRAKP